MRGRLAYSHDPNTVHEFEENGGALRSACGGIEAMHYRVEETGDPLSCADCVAVRSRGGVRVPADPDPALHHDCAVRAGPPDRGRLF